MLHSSKQILITSTPKSLYIYAIPKVNSQNLTSVPLEWRIFCSSSREAIPDVSMFIKAITKHNKITTKEN